MPDTLRSIGGLFAGARLDLRGQTRRTIRYAVLIESVLLENSLDFVRDDDEEPQRRNP